jgi:RNA recognition motif-containing protein
LKIYVGNLSYNTNEQALRDLFAEHGVVEDVHIVTDRDTGRPRGFAFVSMADRGEAIAAIDALNRREFEGRTLNVSEARPKENRGGGGGGGGGRGGGGGGGGGFSRGRRD